MKPTTCRKDTQGMALLVATIFAMIALIALAALTHRVVSQSRRVDKYTESKRCLQGIEFAFAESVSEIEAGWDGHIGLEDWEPPSTWDPSVDPFPAIDFEDPAVAPVQVASMGDVDYLAYVLRWEDDGLDNNGDGQVDELEEECMFTVYAVGRCGGTVRSAELVVGGTDVNVWRNAIFAGSGQAGGLINGNVSIHGSVHLLGDDLLEGAEAIAALDLSGTSLIHNNYEGAAVSQAILDRVPPLPTVMFNGEEIETLNAKLRVKNGLVGLSGNSEIGEPDDAGDGEKETLDGTYVNDGWTGNAVVDDGDRGDPTSVYSDNGWDEGYDLGDRVTLPLLDDDYRDMDTGQTVENPATGANYTHAEYFEDVLTGPPYEGNVTIDAKGGGDFYYNATRPTDPDPANRQPDDDYIYFDGADKRLYINGQVQVNGDLDIPGKPGSVVDYTGRGAILVKGNATINAGLLTMNADGTTDRSFPENNILGIMAEGDMTVGSTAQLDLMGAFYAQGQITSAKQTRVMGTFVSNYFDMGTNVPDIYQVPELASHLPIGMIGAYPIMILDTISWREITYAQTAQETDG